ncbi:ribonuclease P protein component [Xylophilus sp. ASV27]|uniref:ribonuclease P protein component n=1 Tax=Xylophilus sp. ASV27 TaxID=2795129 RepID=UPI0018EB1350
MQRLKTRPQFQAVLAGGIVSRTPHFALHRLVPGAPVDAAALATPLFAPQDDVWLGALVPKRWARRAVTRNAIKRQIYAVGGQAGEHLPRAAYVVRLRSTFDRARFVSASSDALKRAVRAELQQLLGRVTRAPAAAEAATA